MLKISSVSIVYYAFLQTFTAILQTIGKSHIPFLVLLGSLVVRVGLTILLVSLPNINIFGAIISNIVFLSVAVIVLTLFIRKYIDLEYRFFSHLIMPTIIAFVVMLIIYAMHSGLSLIVNYFLSMLISACVGLVIYVTWVYFGRIFDGKEKRKFLHKKKKYIK
jgi:stage V sporulation protein B